MILLITEKISTSLMFLIITFTLVKRIGIAFSAAHFSWDSFEDVGFLVTLLYIISKKLIFSVFGFSVTIFNLLFMKLMQHIWFGVYQIY